MAESLLTDLVKERADLQAERRALLAVMDDRIGRRWHGEADVMNQAALQLLSSRIEELTGAIDALMV